MLNSIPIYYLALNAIYFHFGIKCIYRLGADNTIYIHMKERNKNFAHLFGIYPFVTEPVIVPVAFFTRSMVTFVVLEGVTTVPVTVLSL